MCGIHGIVNLRQGPAPSPEVIKQMGRVTTHRGPDDQGVYADGDVAIGMRRLSIIDVGGGHQPLSNEDNTLWLVCNGEIYNFRELRTDLQAKGHRFKTGSDSEVVLHLYEEFGDDFVKHLDGMFGFALWDTRRRRLLIGRDHLGIKPIYYSHDQKQLSFASELKSLLEVPGTERALCPEGLSEYLTLGYCPAPYSMIDGVKKLPPASLLICEGGKVEIRRYWTLPEELVEGRSEAQWAEQVRSALERAVHAQMVSDVPLGAFLSGGIDSSAVVAFMAGASDRPVKTYAIGFDDGGAGAYYNELPFARQISERFGTQHREIVVRPDVSELLPRLLWHMDEPMADSALLTTYLVSEFARRDVTVILSGVGGDELFGGYRRYLGEYYGGIYNRVPSWLRRGVLTPIARKLPSDRHSPLLNLSRLARTFVLANEQTFEARYRSYVQVFSEEARESLTGTQAGTADDVLSRAFAMNASDEALKRLFSVDMATQLPDDLLMLTDKMTMATSLECRVPFLDRELVELSATMPSHLKIRGRTLKYVLKKALEGVLPHDILHRRKRGFGAPFGAWLKRELAPLLSSVLSRQSVLDRGLLNWDTVERTVSMHLSNKADHTDHLLALLNLELWCRVYLDRRSPEDVSAELADEAAA